MALDPPSDSSLWRLSSLPPPGPQPAENLGPVFRCPININFSLTERKVCTEKISPEVLTVQTEPLVRDQLEIGQSFTDLKISN